MSKRNSFLNFLDQLAAEIEAESQKTKNKTLAEKGLDSFVDFLNDLGNPADLTSQKPNIEAQRKLKANLATKHAAELKKKSAPKEEGDSKARARLKEAERKEVTDKKIDDIKRSKKRKRLRDAVIMAEILAKPVSKRR
ncbi:hypothetical protein NH286_06955 [Anaerococcus sp. NML200574]|uniref:hypothetical protein n=1 Tax=unclassified Anaerococcus TaxID=2614126 RepID=UPI002237E0A6|nr:MULTISPECIES: hypothetical protein [unclassified Anaerococcus]MCW6678892.1 hypothetical protein [Anaerococcus sp. NML200574]MCW6702372.1 hypothetical protein [Anaerococcus sp. NML200537]